MFTFLSDIITSFPVIKHKLLEFPDFSILTPNILLAAAKISVLQLKNQPCFLPDSPYEILPVQKDKETQSFQGD